MGAMYMFPKIDTEMYGIHDDMKFVYDLLVREKVLFVQGTGFNWIRPDHFRIVTLPPVHQIEEAMDKLKTLLAKLPSINLSQTGRLKHQISVSSLEPHRH